MVAPLKTGKQSVKLGGPVRVSRIRRDPPPIAKKIVERDPDERDTRVVAVGVVLFGLAIFILTIAFSAYQAWSPADYEIEVNNL